MTWLVAIDEAGDLGTCTRYFIMSSVIVRRVRALKPVFKTIPHHTVESKFSNSTDGEKIRILRKLSLTDAVVITVIVDKHDYKSKYYGVRGNKLYSDVLSELLDLTFDRLSAHDVAIFIDRSTFISLIDFRHIAANQSNIHRVNLLRCEKVTSNQNKCIQIADYVAGTIFVNQEHGDDKYISIIKEKISFARRY